MKEQIIIDLLKQSDALMEGHFLLSSGRHSGQYVQCAKVMRYPWVAEKVLAPVVEQLKNLEIDILVGPAMGGIIVAYEIGRQLGKEAIFTERKDGKMTLRRGFQILEGSKVLITEDVVTTGKSTLETKKVIESLGGQVVGVASIIDRRGEEKDIGFPLYSAIKFKIESYEAENCPLCEKNIPVEKPGSRQK